jgi:hypothetical protein
VRHFQNYLKLIIYLIHLINHLPNFPLILLYYNLIRQIFCFSPIIIFTPTNIISLLNFTTIFHFLMKL